MAEVSVVLPVYNAASTILRAVQSILNQSHSPRDLIVVDDGSTDATRDVLTTLDDSRLKIISRPHRGVAEAANTGNAFATAPLIARMDADDYSHPNRLESQLKLLHTKELDVVGCHVRVIDEFEQPVPTMDRYSRWINQETNCHAQICALRFVELPIVNPTILARREYFQLGFRNNDFPEDYDLMLRAAASGMRFGKVREVLYDWIDRPQRLTRTSSQFSEAAFMRCRQAHFLAGPLSGVTEVDVWGAGKTGKPWLNWFPSNHITVRRLYDIDTRKIGQTIRGAIVRHPDSLPTADAVPLVIAVGARNARETIRPQIESRGFIAGQNAWFVA